MERWNSEENGFFAGGSPTDADVDDYFTVTNFLRMFGESPSEEEMAEARRDAHRWFEAQDDDEDDDHPPGTRW